MASDNMKMRAQLKGGITEVKVLMSHPMETGRKKDDFDRLIPAHFVQLVTATLNGKLCWKRNGEQVFQRIHILHLDY